MTLLLLGFLMPSCLQRILAETQIPGGEEGYGEYLRLHWRGRVRGIPEATLERKDAGSI